jgi:hypothetical protein
MIFANYAFAQAWTHNKGKGFYKLDLSTIQSKKRFNNDGEIVDDEKLNNSSANLFADFGLSDRITLTAMVPIVRVATDITSNTTLADIDIAMRYAIKKSGLAMSLMTLIGIPNGDNKNSQGLLTGDGEFNQLIKYNIGSGGNKWWTQLGFGFNNRTKGYSDEIRYEGEAGYKLMGDKLLAILKIGGISSLDNGTINLPSRRGLYANEVEYFAPAIELMYYFNKHVGASLRAAGAGSGARNVQASPQFSLGVFADFK